MDLFLKGQESYQKNDLESALLYYKTALENENLEEKNQVICCDKIDKISCLLDYKLDLKTKFLLAETYFKVLNYTSASKYYDLIVKTNESRRAYDAFLESEFQNGNLFKAKKTAYDYLLYCKSRKLYDLGTEVLGKLKRNGLFEKKFQVMEIELELGKGNKPPVLARFVEIAKALDTKSDRFLADEIDIYFIEIKKDWNFWKSEVVIRNVLFKFWNEELKNKQIRLTDVEMRKKMVALAVDDLLLGGKGSFPMLKNYAKYFQNDSIDVSLTEMSEENLDFKDNEAKIHSSIEDTSSFEDCSTRIFTKTEKLQRNIEFILGPSPGIGEIKKALPLLLELREERPDHPFIKLYLDNQEVQDLDTIINEIKVNTSPAKRDLFNMRTDAFLYGLDQNFLIDNAADIMVSLITMELYKSAFKLADKIRCDISDRTDKYKINLAYLELVALKKSGENYKALDVIDDVLRDLPVQGQELDIFLQEKAYLNKRLKNRKGSLKGQS